MPDGYYTVAGYLDSLGIKDLTWNEIVIISNNACDICDEIGMDYCHKFEYEGVGFLNIFPEQVIKDAMLEVFNGNGGRRKVS